MRPPTQPSTDRDSAEQRRSTVQALKLPFRSSSHFLQTLLLCLLALAALIAQISGGSLLDAVLATGIGLLLGWLLYPKRLFILAALVLPLGIVNQLFDQGIISGKYLEAAHLLALALGLLTITWAMRVVPAWVHPGARSPGVVVAALGLLLLAAEASAAAARIIFSFWLPAAVLGALGLWYLLMSAFGRVKP
jgi:hypothetical protein